ncbi:MAG: HlyD family type I secretion periplasmic adaptor subunit [Gammaproteobacteria bacterium]|nr:HlyD family type I secretion periplasmic adaptor subunit [Gammaproteobacteria bacterium]MBU1555612.1 HlyD family type I secretion periplasmic adaptor subunit [Gammaproteobacteria bacterium]MBU2069906.1 HlyD family type I secretion periplasmic adaptor subunit [Gammaproteobacteria bacterium]MBU2184812.1 HlyD family type I secretion periplasmic adaptor subunit [Gammaproteobacteria bacterium]MBU2204348.1 HlyD family type I secretion periplasmic adaptor subunit [Gammaproteobacteria bacterium]
MRQNQHAANATTAATAENRSAASNVIELPLAKRLSREQLSFLPAALEIEAAPPAPYSRIILWAIMALLVLAIAWACWGQIDITASAQGKLVPGAKVKTIQPLNAGVVQHIHVREGQKVQAGDVLLTLDGTIAEADLQRLTLQLNSVKQDIARTELLQQRLQQLQSQADITALSLPQQQALNSSWQEYQARQLSVQRQIDKLDAEVATTKLNIGRIEKTLPLITEQADSVQQLLAKSLASRSQYLELELNRINQAESLTIEQAKLQQLAAGINEATQQQQVLQAEFQRQLSDALNQYHRDASTLEQELIKAQTTNAQQQLLAPVDGTVEQLVLTTIGGVVTPAQELMRIVPLDQQLVAEAWLLNKDIGFVEVGQTAELKLESFEFTKYGVIDGEIIDISTDAVEMEGVGLVFPLKVALKQHSIKAGNKTVPLGSGMAVTVEVKTGQRRIIEFLLSPVMKAVDEGVRER